MAKTKNNAVLIEDNEPGYEHIVKYHPGKLEKISKSFREIIGELGENPAREGLRDTPKRVAQSMQYLTHGYSLNPDEILKKGLFREDHKHMVVVKNIELFSLCEHHLLPFYGKAHVAYIPKGYIVGLSKIARVVDAFARRMQVQERLTDQIKECIDRTLKPLGVIVVIEAVHLCMLMRGIQKQNSVATTSSFTGAFQRESTRLEFFNIISSDLH